ncbi:glutamic acid-rich protein-like [Hippocampus comes]|uniref:glutamic acid-rich protein-like n=1 Tax=Hippocampus comes TaxID=109280 RepID=UPI00094F1DBC|nr:PREDICTED: glutamic acid-rich protein-like [Hippocampus comes]
MPVYANVLNTKRISSRYSLPRCDLNLSSLYKSAVMAASEENLLSLGHLNGRNVNTFSIYRNMTGNIHKTSHMIHLRQRWQELKDRERAARHQNQELLKQFDRAQDTLREMMAATAAMKTIRMEYEPFLIESSPNRHKQLQDKTPVPKSQRMEECMDREEEIVSASSVGKYLFSQGHGRKPQIDSVTQGYNGFGRSYPPYIDSLSSQSHSDQTITASVLPPTLHPCPQNFQLQHLIATPSRQCRARQNLPEWATNQADGRHSSVVSYPEDAVTSGSSRRKNIHLSQELDFKPVRLSSEHGENRDSCSSSSTGNRQVKSEKKRRKTNTSSERDISSSLESKTSSPVMAQISESEASSHKGSTSSRMRRNITDLLRTRNETQECESPKSCSISELQSEREVSQTPLHQSESSSRCNSSSRSEESSGESDKAVEGVNNKGLEEDEKADCKIDGKEESDMEEASEDEETSPEDERENESDEDQGCNISDELNKNSEEEHSAQDEEEDGDGSEDNIEEDRSDEGEQMSEERAEEKDSDDIIISPQQNKPRVHFILQESSEDDNSKEGCRTGTSDEDSSESGDDDIDNLLAPQPQTKIREEKVRKAVEEPKSITTKVICNMEIFRGETHTDRQSDSDEFDHFYD